MIGNIHIPCVASCSYPPRENRRKRDANDGKWQGLAFSLDAAAYGG